MILGQEKESVSGMLKSERVAIPVSYCDASFKVYFTITEFILTCLSVQ